MTHIAGHPVIDRMAHAVGISQAHNHNSSQTKVETQENTSMKKGDSLSIQNNTSTLKNAPTITFHSHDVSSTGYGDWKPFKSSKTGAAVGAMSGQVFGVVAGFSSAAAVAGISKDYKMALAVGASVYLASLGAGAVGGAVGYKTRSMNIDTTEPPMGSMFDSPAKVLENEKKADEVWKKALK